MITPVPKYSVGAHVYGAETELRPLPQVCPDCLGTFKWTITTPAGETFSVDCGTCTYERIIPQHRYFPVTRQLVIGSVRLDTYDTECPVTYMMRETGVGSGRVWRETEVCDSEQEAMLIAHRIAAECNARMTSDALRKQGEAKKRTRRKPSA